MRIDPVGSVTGTRTRHDGTQFGKSVTLTAVRFSDTILLIQPILTDEEATIRINTVSDRELAASLSALLFTDEELEALAK